ncbi:hypothetical protein MBLNU459_g4921t3 [Dothideomycetes sp. NU459]
MHFFQSSGARYTPLPKVASNDGSSDGGEVYSSSCESLEKAAGVKPIPVHRNWRYAIFIGIFLAGALIGAGLIVLSTSYSGCPSLQEHASGTVGVKQFAPQMPTRAVVFSKKTALMDPPDETNQHVWDAMTPVGHGFVNVSQPEAYGLLPGIPTASGVDRYSVAMYHQLHCLGLLRSQYWRLIDGMSADSTPATRQEEVRKQLRDHHSQHCFAYIAESIICAGDLTIEWAKVEKDGAHPTNSPRLCSPGLLLALLLSTLTPRPHITVLDAAAALDAAPRATHYGPPAIQVLRRAGVLGRVRERGFMPSTICWRKLDGTRLAGLNPGLLHEGGDDADGMTVLPVGDLGKVMMEVLEERGLGVRWGEKVVGLGGQEEGAEEAWVEVESAEDRCRKRYVADYVVGCDGGNSSVRRLLFGKGSFPGFTWLEQIVATNFGWEDTQFIIDPEHWYMAARISAKGLWRISYGELPGLSNEELLARQPMKFQKMLPGHPTPDQYKIVSISPYRVHQRCVESMVVGRVCLAADAAHLCNPFGGLGLTGGIVDVDGLFDCLRGIHSKIASQSILNVYSDVRMARWRDIVNPISTSNIRRMFALDPETALEKDDFLKTCRKAETDMVLSKKMQNSSAALRYDFAQHYDTADLTDGTKDMAVIDRGAKIDTNDAVAEAIEAVAT